MAFFPPKIAYKTGMPCPPPWIVLKSPLICLFRRGNALFDHILTPKIAIFWGILKLAFQPQIGNMQPDSLEIFSMFHKIIQPTNHSIATISLTIFAHASQIFAQLSLISAIHANIALYSQILALHIQPMFQYIPPNSWWSLQIVGYRPMFAPYYRNICPYSGYIDLYPPWPTK